MIFFMCFFVPFLRKIQFIQTLSILSLHQTDSYWKLPDLIYRRHSLYYNSCTNSDIFFLANEQIVDYKQRLLLNSSDSRSTPFDSSRTQLYNNETIEVDTER